MSVRLSPALRAAVPLATAEVLRELERLGQPARRRSRPGRPDIWWARPPDIGLAIRAGEEEPGTAGDART